jgi:bisphosphoglycerate-independent phosphoglycerate mutase (AlkP superfamily)
VIITADHGGHGRMHGSEMPEDMTIPMIFLGAGADRIKNLDDANIKDIAPTVATLLGVTPDPEWEGKSLI